MTCDHRPRFQVNDGRVFINGDYSSLMNELPISEELNEMKYREIMARIDKNFLLHEIRARALDGTNFHQIKSKSLWFKVNSSQHITNSEVYQNIVLLKDWDNTIDNSNLTPVERAKYLMIEGSDIALHCNCASFLFWGYQWLLTQEKAAIVPEKRPPVKRNPQHRGIMCKHLNRTMKALPFHIMTLSRYIKKNHDIREGKDSTTDNTTKLLEELKKNPKKSVKYHELF